MQPRLNVNSGHPSSVELLQNQAQSLLEENRVHVLYMSTLRGDADKEKTLTLFQVGKVQQQTDSINTQIEVFKQKNH